MKAKGLDTVGASIFAQRDDFGRIPVDYRPTLCCVNDRDWQKTAPRAKG